MANSRSRHSHNGSCRTGQSRPAAGQPGSPDFGIGHDDDARILAAGILDEARHQGLGRGAVAREVEGTAQALHRDRLRDLVRARKEMRRRDQGDEQYCQGAAHHGNSSRMRRMGSGATRACPCRPAPCVDVSYLPAVSRLFCLSQFLRVLVSSFLSLFTERMPRILAKGL